jgi:hypothetical protein
MMGTDYRAIAQPTAHISPETREQLNSPLVKMAW